MAAPWDVEGGHSHGDAGEVLPVSSSCVGTVGDTGGIGILTSETVMYPGGGDLTNSVIFCLVARCELGTKGCALTNLDISIATMDPETTTGDFSLVPFARGAGTGRFLDSFALLGIFALS